MIPIEFLRQFRFNGYAIFDFAIVFLVIYFLSPLLSKMFLKLRIKVAKQNWLFLILPISILAHLLVGKITPMTRDFIDMQSHYILKILILGLLLFGLKGIKIVKKQKT
jgi:ABC-type dipeptide/oligopeptide/nickel transport system permease component